MLGLFLPLPLGYRNIVVYVSGTVPFGLQEELERSCPNEGIGASCDHGCRGYRRCPVAPFIGSLIDAVFEGWMQRIGMSFFVFMQCTLPFMLINITRWCLSPYVQHLPANATLVGMQPPSL